MSRVDGLSLRSKPDLLQRHKTSTNKYNPFTEKRGEKGSGKDPGKSEKIFYF